jgi:hypothetical protein
MRRYQWLHLPSQHFWQLLLQRRMVRFDHGVLRHRLQRCVWDLQRRRWDIYDSEADDYQDDCCADEHREGVDRWHLRGYGQVHLPGIDFRELLQSVWVVWEDDGSLRRWVQQGLWHLHLDPTRLADQKVYIGPKLVEAGVYIMSCA